jgi:lipoprotein-anchoring transpeptidase ErfK/SrfK
MRRMDAERKWGSGQGRRGQRRLFTVGSVLLVAVLAGCTSGGTTAITPAADDHGGGGVAPGGQGGKASAPVVPPARLGFRPANGTQNISPVVPVSVTAAAGRLTAVTVRNEAGKAVRGAWSADRTRWTSAEPLGYAKTYEVTATAVNSAGQPTRQTGRFSTVTPVTYTMPYLFPGPDVKTVGVGQPLTVHFDEAITDQAAAERALSVKTIPATAGSWYWFDNQNVHYRLKSYWHPGTKVTVTANLYGVHVGGGIYGQQDVRSSFTIGQSRIATIDDNTHMMTVRVAGQVVRHIPVSMGRGGSIKVGGKTIYFTTASGPHVVQEKYAVKKMSSASYGLPVNSPLGYEENIPLAVRVSADGEFVHAASWSVAQQGRRNVSHGCINISPANADWFYHTFTYGDIVDIKNTGAMLQPGNKYGDWMVSWSDWLAGSALR